MTRIMHSSQRQQGFSLVEIMVAMTLGLVLLGGTITLYASSKDSYRLQENIAGLQENARFAIHALRRDVEMAGFPMAREIVPFNIAETLDGGGNTSDQLSIQYNSSNPPNNTDCLGTVVAPPGTLITNRYTINNDGDLVCQGNTNNLTQTLVENVINMQALYGVDTDANGSANQYLRANEVTALPGNPWLQVVSLRLALLVASETAVGPAPRPPLTLLDAVPAFAPADNRLYRVFTTTIPLRNRIP
ncbi:MAG: PilW family protein [Gammaproteobacteria bacterium]|nr:PilW family protein [Gammaproteobacteria bacterium]